MELPSIKKILLTTDLSQDATSAYTFAASLAKAYHCQLIALTCIDTSLQYAPSGIGSIEIPSVFTSERMEELKSAMIKDMTEHLKVNFSDIPITHEVCEAPTGVQHTITNYIANNQIDLVVMSSHGRSGIARALLGSVTEYVLRHSKKPVLVVPA